MKLIPKLNRLKEEKAQKKKFEEKQRRDLIFQKYLQRKSEMSETNSDDDSVKQFAVSNPLHSAASAKSSSRLKPPSLVNKKQRPRSQLVIGSSPREVNSDFSGRSNYLSGVFMSSSSFFFLYFLRILYLNSKLISIPPHGFRQFFAMQTTAPSSSRQ